MSLFEPEDVAYRSYNIYSPHDGAIQTACEDAGCLAWRYGWETKVDESADLGKTQAEYIRRRSGRTFRESRSEGLTVFRFESGQRCFVDHQTLPEFFRVRYSNRSGRPAIPIRTHSGGRDFMEDMGLHLQEVVDWKEHG